MQDLARGGFALGVAPSTDTGYKSYGAGRLFLPFDDGSNDVGVASVLQYPHFAVLPPATIAARVVPLYSSASPPTVLAAFAGTKNNAGNDLSITTRIQGGIFYLHAYEGVGNTFVSIATGAYSAGAAMRFIARIAQGPSGTLDLLYNGTAAAQVANPRTLDTGGILEIANLPGNTSYQSPHYIGPVAICNQRITDAETVLLDAMLTAGARGVDVFRFFKDRSYPGTLVLPLEGDSRGYVVL